MTYSAQIYVIKMEILIWKKVKRGGTFPRKVKRNLGQILHLVPHTVVCPHDDNTVVCTEHNNKK